MTPEEWRSLHPDLPPDVEKLYDALDELTHLRREREAIDVAITAAEDVIKDYMGSWEDMVFGTYRVRWQTVTTSRIDTAALKRNCPATAERYTRTTTCRRFTVSAV